ncbi:MAG TPA: outer membrane protein transport protein [Anaeromyxobacter sp.]|nr:outer membrane protein transport protein [Anaeromyxobacter sp.]
MRTLKLVLALLVPSVVLANGYDVPNVNPRDLAMVSSTTAAQMDAEATFANPAALSRLEGLNLQLAGSLLGLEEKYSGPDTGPLAGQSSHTKSPLVVPLSLFASYGFKVADHNAGIGLGMNIPAGGNVYWPEDWVGRGSIITVDRKIYGFYLTGGYEVVPKLRLGGGLIYYYGTEYLKQGIQPFPDAYGELATKGGAFSFDLSAEYTLSALPLSFGVDFKYKGTLKMSGNGHYNVPQGALPGTPPPVDQGVKHDLTYPSALNVGVAYRVLEPWLFSFTFTWNGYSVYQSDTFVGDKGTTITVPRNYKDGYTFRFGTEFDLNPKLQLRAGVERDISGLDASVYSPSLPDSNSWCGALGAAWWIEKDFSLQGAFFYAWLDPVTTDNPQLPGTFKTEVWVASAGITWRTDLGSK